MPASCACMEVMFARRVDPRLRYEDGTWLRFSMFEGNRVPLFPT